MYAIVVDGENFVAQILYIEDVIVGDFGSHWNFGRFFDFLFNIFGQNVGQVCVHHVLTCADQFDGFDEGNVIGDDLAEFGEMPSVPALPKQI